jgi:hypothetical protein
MVINENQIRMSLNLQLTGTTKNGAFMECNFRKSPEEFVELFYSGLLSA